MILRYDQYAPVRNEKAEGNGITHLSNAGIKHPNLGINFSQIYVQYNY